MNFSEKCRYRDQLAKVTDIERYKTMLQMAGQPIGSFRERNQKLLAKMLVYTLLDHYTPEQIASFKPSQGLAPITKEISKTAATSKPSVKKKISKFEEYPGINWKDLDNPQVRTADSIFTDRVNCWSMLKEIEGRVGVASRSATVGMLSQLVNLSIRLELCFAELRHFNDTGTFIGKHPFITQKSERERVTALLRENPSSFLEEMKNIDGNIARYKSHINSDKFSAAKKKKEAENLQKYETLKAMYQDVLNQNIKK